MILCRDKGGNGWANVFGFTGGYKKGGWYNFIGVKWVMSDKGHIKLTLSKVHTMSDFQIIYAKIDWI